MNDIEMWIRVFSKQHEISVSALMVQFIALYN